MKKIVSAILVTISLSGCTHQLDLISRNNSGNGSGTVQELGKEITINLHGQTYTGTYIYDGTKTIRSMSLGGAIARNGSVLGSGLSTTHIPGSGDGKALVICGNNTLRCDFNAVNGKGIGYCQDNVGKEYDLLIR